MWNWRKSALAAAGLIAALAAPSVVTAQTGSIVGTVTDKATKQPVENVQVRVQGTSYGFATKANGTYSILGVPPGTYTVVASRIGYAPTEVSNVVVFIDVRREQNIELTTQSATPGAVQSMSPRAQT